MAIPQKSEARVRYAVVGLGYFAQQKVLPAFANARRSCTLVALFSNDAAKRTRLSERYEVAHALPYEQYNEFLRSGAVDAVYIALPNRLHCDYTVGAAQAGVHVLCEKPMAINTDECERMLDACADAGVRLMIGYRLHFEEANMSSVELVRAGRIGEPRFLQSSFSYQVRAGNTRTRSELGGGPMYDLGIYCINAARYLLRAEPEEVVAFTGRRDDPRFAEVEEQTSALLRFPGNVLCALTAGFGAAAGGHYELVATKGRLRLDPAFDYDVALEQTLTIGERSPRRRRFAVRDQVAPELIYFAECIRTGVDPEPSGREGMADVRIIEAIYESARSGRAVKLQILPPERRPSVAQVQKRPRAHEPELLHADTPFQ
jgi:glucose-fructose oxidoreductase